MKKKTIGWMLILVGIFLLNPIPGVDDVIPLKIYSAAIGENINYDNLSEHYLDYFIWTTIVGILLVFVGMKLMGWNWGRLKKKFDLGSYKFSILAAILVVAYIAYAKITSITSVIVICLLVPFIYYHLIRKDKSEAISLALTSYLAWLFGLAYLFSFIFQKAPLPEQIETTSPVLIWISQNMGFEYVSSISLAITIIIGGILIFVLNKFLKEKI